MPEPMPKRGVADSQLRNWARGERKTPPPPEAVAELLAENDSLHAWEQAARPVLDAARAVDTAWSEGRFQVGPHGTQALARLRAALGSAEAGAPTRPVPVAPAGLAATLAVNLAGSPRLRLNIDPRCLTVAAPAYRVDVAHVPDCSCGDMGTRLSLAEAGAPEPAQDDEEQS